MPKPVYQATPPYAPGRTDRVPADPATKAHRRELLIAKWSKQGRLFAIAAGKRAKERLAEGAEPPQESGPKGRSGQLRGVETRDPVPTVPLPAKTQPDHCRRKNPVHPDGTPGVQDKLPTTASSSGLLGTWKQRDVSLKNQRVGCPSLPARGTLALQVYEQTGKARIQERLRIADVFDSLGSWSDRADRMRKCCSVWSMVRVPRSRPEEARPIPSIHCRDRLCPECRRARSGRVARKIRPVIDAAIADGWRPIFVTLTQVATQGEAPDQAMKRLNKSWGKLIRSIAWKSHVAAAINFREFGDKKKGKAWHAHSHLLLLVRGNFWDRDELIKLWGRHSPGAWNVDVRYVSPGVEAELAQYGMKAVDLDDDEIIEYAIAMKGARLISATGAWKGALSDEDIEVDDLEDGDIDIAIYDLEEMRSAGDVWATRVLTAVDRWIEVRLFHGAGSGSP